MWQTVCQRLITLAYTNNAPDVLMANGPENDIVFKLERTGSPVAPSKGIRIQDIREILA